ncbi:MAG: DUF5103 domain-containing protein [Bacteroidales bacterium]|nr:DUF5103 domain-containing protein [Bacteroidales bacterium]
MRAKYFRLIYISFTTCFFACKTSNNFITSQNNDFYSQDRIKTINYVYDPNVRSVVVAPKDWSFGFPIILLNKIVPLEISFDLLGDTYKEFHYRIRYCDMKWQKLDIPFFEYAEGYEDNVIENFSLSRSYPISYVHYSFQIPNDKLKPLRSGNYLLEVFHFDEKGNEKLTFVHRFMVSEQILPIELTVKKADDIEKRSTHHQIEIKLNPSFLQNPLNNVRIVVLQNKRWDNALYLDNPDYIREEGWIYRNQTKYLFPSMNDFRAINIKSLHSVNEWVQNMKGNHVYLKPIMPRNSAPYISFPDLNGAFIVKSDDDLNTNVDGEYVFVHMKMPYSSPRKDGYFYVTGDFTAWSTDTLYRMKYNDSTRSYEATLLLKQGYYNYQIAFLPIGKNSFDFSLVEGYISEADNDYFVFVYFRDPATLYDRLIGFEVKRTPRGWL